MPQPRDPASVTHPTRAYCKIVIVAAVLGTILGALITAVQREELNDLRHHLTLWLIIALIAIINIMSFLLFALFWTIYRWIKRDLDPATDD